MVQGIGLSLLTIAGLDLVGASARLFEALATAEAPLVDVEQVTIQGQLVLSCLVEAPPASLDSVRAAMAPLGLAVTASTHDRQGLGRQPDALHVTVLGVELGATVMARLAAEVASAGANIDRISQLARYPLTAYELLISGGSPADVRDRLSGCATALGVDVAVQDDGIHRRAKRLIVLDVDSTLVQGEVIDELAARAGCEAEVAAITRRAMQGELDFAASLRERVALLTGLPADVLGEVLANLRLMPGARTLVRTLHQLGYAVGIVSGGFTFATDHLKTELDLDFAEANTLEIADGRLTGRLSGPVVDRAGKAVALRHFAAARGVDLSQTVAVGDGANDLDMLAAAGLGIAFNAKPLVRREAAASLTVPYLDAVLFLLGLSEQEIAALG